MGSIKKYSFVNGSTDYGTIAKKLVEGIASCCGFTIVQVGADTTSTYEAYLSAFDNTDCLVKIWNSSSSYYAQPYFYDQNGEYTVAGRTYCAPVSKTTINVPRYASDSNVIIGVQTDSVRMCVLNSDNNSVFGFAKTKDIFTGEEFYIVTIYPYSLYCGFGNGSVLEFASANYTSTRAAHPYVRAYPMEYGSETKQNVVNTLGLEFYQIQHGDGWLASGVGSVVSINGHKYICMNKSYGAYIRFN